MSKIIIIKSCNSCPYCKDHFTTNKKIYEGTSCTHPENKKRRTIFLGDYKDREKVHSGCPLKDMDDDVDMIVVYRDGEPCGHLNCLNHITHPCEGCGRIMGQGDVEIPRFIVDAWKQPKV